MDDSLVTVRTYFAPQEATMAESMLRAHGVHAFIQNEGAIYTAFGGTAGGVQLQVPAAEVERAVALLEEDHGALNDEEE